MSHSLKTACVAQGHHCSAIPAPGLAAKSTTAKRCWGGGLCVAGSRTPDKCSELRASQLQQGENVLSLSWFTLGVSRKEVGTQILGLTSPLEEGLKL